MTATRPHGVSPTVLIQLFTAQETINHVWPWVTARLLRAYKLIRCITTVRTARGRAEQGPSGSRGVVVGHVRRVVDGHPPGRRDSLGSGLLAVSGHLRLTLMI